MQELHGIRGVRRLARLFLVLGVVLASATLIASLLLFGAPSTYVVGPAALCLIGITVAFLDLVYMSWPAVFRMAPVTSQVAYRKLLIPSILVGFGGCLVSVLLYGASAFNLIESSLAVIWVPATLGFGIVSLACVAVAAYLLKAGWYKARVLREERKKLSSLRSTYSAAELARIESSLRFQAGSVGESPAWIPRQHCLPGLTQKPWWDPAEFPWTRELEEKAPIIKDEYEAVVKARGTEPYRFIGVGKDWSMASIDDSMKDICPVTCELLDKVFRDKKNGWSPRKPFFSILPPGGVIKPHRDQGNIDLTCHLGLSVPPDCGIKVGTESRSWEEGKCIIFDTSFSHSAWNRSSEPRIVLLIDFSHPELTEPERQFFDRVEGNKRVVV